MEVARTVNTSDGKDEEVTLPGFRFHPTDEELVGFYLQRKVDKKPISIEVIKQIDIYKYDPWDLPKVSNVGEKEWYFFCKRGRKYRNSMRPNRVTDSGFWKATGIDKPIFNTRLREPQDHHQQCIIGLKKSLVYYLGHAGKGTKTDWMMHEFRLPPANYPTNIPNPIPLHNIPQEAEVWTLCRIFKRIPTFKKYTPNIKETCTTLQQLNPRDSSPRSTCSLESDMSTETVISFCDSIIKQDSHERKPTLNGHLQLDHYQDNERNNMLVSHWGPLAFPSAFGGSDDYQSLGNSNGDQDVFANGNCDELRPMVHLVVDHHHHPYRGYEYT